MVRLATALILKNMFGLGRVRDKNFILVWVKVFFTGISHFFFLRISGIKWNHMDTLPRISMLWDATASFQVVFTSLIYSETG